MAEPTSLPSVDKAAVQIPQSVPAAFGWAAVVASGGGLGCGFLMSQLSKNTQYGILGGLLLWGLGALAGIVCRKITKAPHRAAAWAIVVACVLAFGIAEVSWCHWTFKIRDEATDEFRPQTWIDSFTRGPKLLWREAPISLLLAAVSCAFGAHDAYRRAGKRYRLVAIAEDS